MKISKKKIFITVAALCLVAVIAVVSLLGGTQYTFSAKEFEDFYKANTTVPQEISISWNNEGYAMIGENQWLSLEFDNNIGAIRITDKASGEIYSSHFDESKLESVPKNKKLRQGLQSVCSISYADSTGVSEVTNSADSSVKCKATPLKNGVSLKYHFNKPDISLTLNVWIEDKNLVAQFASRDVVENGEFSLMSVDFLPMLMSAADNEQGYIVYPEGSGALYRWGNADTTRTTVLTRDVWSDRNIDIDKISDSINSGVRGILIPAAGVKRTNGSVVGYIEHGAEYTSISLATSQYMFAVNRVYPSAIYRKTGTYIGANGVEYTQIDKNTDIDNITIRYAFGGENSDYSSMAADVRNMMMASGDLPESKKEPYSMKLDIINGAVEETVLYSAYKVATTLDEAGEMTSYLDKNGVKGMAVELLGWQDEGYGLYPASGNLQGKVGSQSELKALAKQVKDMNSDLFLSVNIVNASGDLGGFSKRSDVIYDATDVGITNAKGTDYILNPIVAQKAKNQSFTKALSNTGIAGFSYEGIGKILFEDYNTKRRMDRTDTIAVHKSTLKTSAEVCEKAIAQHGNSYILSNADMITDVPSGTSAYPALQEAVPFYELIVHGNVSYTLDAVANLSHDITWAKLKWLEYGAVPYFVMSHSGSEVLTSTNASVIYSSSFSDWKTRIVEIYNEFAPFYEKVGSSDMIKHEKLSDGVYKTTYDSGNAVTVDYNNGTYIFE